MKGKILQITLTILMLTAYAVFAGPGAESPKPYVGQIVLYSPAENKTVPAIVMDINEDGSLNLNSFEKYGLTFRFRVLLDDKSVAGKCQFLKN